MEIIVKVKDSGEMLEIVETWTNKNVSNPARSYHHYGAEVETEMNRGQEVYEITLTREPVISSVARYYQEKRDREFYEQQEKDETEAWERIRANEKREAEEKAEAKKKVA